MISASAPVGTVIPPAESECAEDHAQVVALAWDGTPVEVDCGMARFLGAVWRLGYRTWSSCEGDAGAVLPWVAFDSAASAARFAAEHGGEIRPDMSAVVELPSLGEALAELVGGRE